MGPSNAPLVDDDSLADSPPSTMVFGAMDFEPDHKSLKPVGSVLRARVRPPQPQSTRSGEDELRLKYHLAMSHPTYAAWALNDPSAMDRMRSEYLGALKHDEKYPECWWTAGHLKQELYRRLVKEANSRGARSHGMKTSWASLPATGRGHVPLPVE